ncbi:ATP-binding protein [Paucibacter sp. APW11]|uniref:histidine kinase n=1 Tax=Roseateles aquae TaxID=3077235 RepID=A0ABU3PC83_9BURK|nr:ATP-binding protein [Paucibacter sp. APW11]MDT8999446.1 ATP-binding protein [Paucibacter sp. APW11]
MADAGETLELFASEEAVQAAERRLSQAQGAELWLLRAWLAWALRQRDSQRADGLAACLLEELAGPDQAVADVPPARREPTRARLLLVRAEAALLQLDMDRADQLLQQALQLMQSQQDWCGCADAHWLGYYLAADRGDSDGLMSALETAIVFARQAGDASRVLVFQATLARAQVFRDVAVAERKWGSALPPLSAGLPPAEMAAVADFRGLLAALSADYVPSIRAFAQAYEAALQTGQLRRAISLATNLGFAHTTMSDFQTAMEWLRRGLELARSARWPALISLCLAHTGEALRRLGQANDARDLLHECLQLQQQQPDARTTMLALKFLAQTELDAGRPADAQLAFETLAQRARSASALDLEIDAGLGRARALLLQAQFEPARQVAAQVLAQAGEQHERGTVVEALWVLADIEHAANGDTQVAQHCYRQALRHADKIEGYQPPIALLDACARCEAARGDFEPAYRCAARASELRQRSYSEETQRRSSALQAHHQVERARAESEHLRRLAESEAARFEALKGAHEALLHLGAIGQEITAELDADRVFEVLERHVHAMLHTASMSIYLLDDSGQQLLCAFGMEGGESFVDPPIDALNSNSYCARSVRERREFTLGAQHPPDLRHHIPGTAVMNSVMVAPLIVAERVIGVMTVQSPKGDAYGEREQLIFRNLCSYGAIALDNARAYLRLGELQRHVMAQEKLAALGAMVAGVAHELNTPIGNSLLVASTLLGSARDFEQRVARQALRRADWQQFAGRSREGLEVIERSMEAAASLVRSFKQVAVDRSAEQRRDFLLHELCEQYVQTMGLMLRRAGIGVRMEVPPALSMQGYPGSLGQVLVILLNNAMVHGFEGRSGGTIEIGALPRGPEHVQLWVADDGVGMTPAVLARIFEPFFSTKFGQGGSGLGLSICHNIVESLLGGSIRVSSEPGLGCRFTLELPMRSP